MDLHYMSYFLWLFGDVPYYSCLTSLILFSSLPGDTLLHTFSLEVHVSPVF